MKSSRQKFSFYTFHNDHSTPPPHTVTKNIPIESQPTDLPQEFRSTAAATKIQSSYRSHLIRTLYKKISSVNSQATEFQHLIQRQETIDSIRSNEREKLRMNEALMGLLLRLDSVPGVDPTVREVRRKVSRRLVGLQEILDAVAEAKVEEGSDEGFMMNWDDVVGGMEEEVCRERGGEEMERFCAEQLGFRCLQRFLREP